MSTYTRTLIQQCIAALIIVLFIYFMYRQSSKYLEYTEITTFSFNPLKVFDRRTVKYFEEKVCKEAIQTYEEINCSTSYEPVYDVTDQEKRLQQCSTDILRTQMKKTGAFPAHGKWSGTPEDPTFHPSFCTFRDTPVNCLRKHTIPTKITIMGDSNAECLAEGFKNTMIGMEFMCEMVKKEQITELRQPSYFQNEIIDADSLEGSPSLMRGMYDYCRMYNCTSSSTHNNGTYPGQIVTLTLEYISLSNLIENTLHFKWKKNNDYSKLFATFTEYIFKHYLKYTGFPDLLIMYPPFHHEKIHAALSEIALDIVYVDNLMQIFLPQKTQVFWIPDGRECPAMYQTHVSRLLRQTLQNGMTSNQRIHALNRVLYKALGWRFLDRSSGIHGFLDLNQISCPLMCQFHKDPAHMIQGFYDVMANYLLQLSCG